MLPVGVHGGGDRLDIQNADARFGSFICSITKTTLELSMIGGLDSFDGFLFSSICDTARNLCWVMKRNQPDKYVDFLHLPHNPASPSSVGFLAAEYQRLRSELERISGRPITDEAIRQSIALYNENRELTQRLTSMRSASPQLMPASELYLVLRAGHFLPVGEHSEMLVDVIEHLRTATGKVRDSIRVVVEGSFCEQPPLDLITIIEQAGCYIVDDDFVLGRRWHPHDVNTEGDPIHALADAYVNNSVYSSVRHDFRQPRFVGLIDKVRANKADAVICLIAKFCEPAYFDYVLFKKSLEEAGIPHILLEFEEKLFTFERLKMEVETFAESLLFV
jgi:benzoyl-CoA reductase subunit C